jgi:hypothetical protein
MEQEQNPTTPEIQVPEPSYGNSFSHGWATMKKYFIELLLAFFVYLMMSLPMGVAATMVDPEGFSDVYFPFFNFIYSLIVMSPISFGISYLFLKAVRGETFKVQEIFYAFQQIWNIVLANLLLMLIIGLGFVLLIVPGIIFACKLVFVPFLVMDRKLDAVEAIKKSWAMTKGHGWKIFGMGVMSFFIVLAGIICLVVGIFPAIIWIQSAFATLYWHVTEKEKRQAVVA